MDWTQYIIATVYAGAIALALWRGGIAPALVCVIAAQFAGMVTAGDDLRLIIVIDGLTIAALVHDGSDMALRLVYAFIASIVIEAGGEMAGLPFNTTTAIVDLTIVMIAVIIGWSNGRGGRLDFVMARWGRLGHGMGADSGRSGRGRIGRALPLASRYNAAFDLAGFEAMDSRGLTSGPR